MNNVQKALQINPNLKIVKWYLDQDFAGLKKGDVYKIVDHKTCRQTCDNFQTAEKAWSYVVDHSVASTLAKD
jgi:hypothetical protein